MITIPNWMFLGSFSDLRRNVFQSAPVSSLVHIGRGVWGSDFGSCSFILERSSPKNFKGSFLRLFDKQGSVASNEELVRRFYINRRFIAPNAAFEKIPGNPIAYWANKGVLNIFEACRTLGDIAVAKQGLSTADNNKYVRSWHEVSYCKTGFDIASRDEAKKSEKTWFPLNKGGGFRKWYGNQEFVVNWKSDGKELKNSKKSVIRNSAFYFKPSVSWSDITISHNSFREYEQGFIHSNVGHSAFGEDRDWRSSLLAYCNTKFVGKAAKLLSPTVHFDVGYFNNLPYAEKMWNSDTVKIARESVAISRKDWDSYEISWGFQSHSILRYYSGHPDHTIKSCFIAWINKSFNTIAEIKRLEEENNRLFIEAYGMHDELTPEVPLEEITLTCNPHYRYGSNRSEEELETLLQCDTLKELVSYTIGCMMGRYSLDQPGLILASQGETVRDYLAQIPEPSFAPDENAIIPLTDQEWFPDDATNRFRDFVRTVWGEEHLQENLDFVAESLCLNAIKPKKGEAALETIRRYLSTQFFKDHRRTYKKRPIYWLFSSGKQKAFECLVYLHRYNESTLAEMRTDYVIPLTEKLASYVEKLEQDKEASASAAEAKRIEKELSKLYKQQAELNAFDEKLRHYADQRISLDLDDGVKVNYGKFGDLLAEVKQITGE